MSNQKKDKGVEDSPHWWLRPMTVETLRDLRGVVRRSHEEGQGLSSCTMNQIRIALFELQKRIEEDEQRSKTGSNS